MANFDVFISFSQRDKPTADAACAMLEANGVTCWIAPRDIPYGQNWGEGIMAGINQSRLMVLIFSSSANESHHVHREVERAVNRGIPVIPFRIENVAPGRGLEYFLSLPNWLDAFTPPLEPYLRTLVKSVKDLLQTTPAEPRPVRSDTAPTPQHRPSRWTVRHTIAAGFTAIAMTTAALAWTFWPKTQTSSLLTDATPALSSPAGTAPPPPGPIGLPPSPDKYLGPAAPAKEVVVSFASVNTAAAPSFLVAAAPYLHRAGISIAIEDIEPAESRVVLVNNMGLYEGKAVAPTLSQTFLTQVNTGNVPASFTLKFSEPVASVSFVVPQVWPATTSGITFPAWRAQALSNNGQELSTASLGLVRRFADVPAQTFTLTAPAFDGIAAVKFTSDPRLDGTPFAAFSAILIEQMTLTRP